MRKPLVLPALATVLSLAGSIAWEQGAAAGPLRAYNVDPSQVSVSGHEYGAEMAMQIGIAYSSRIMGVGIFAPASAYNCRRPGTSLGWSECNLLYSESVAQLEAAIRDSSGRQIDEVEHLKRQRIYTFAGAYATPRTTTAPKIVKLYERFVAAGNVRFEDTYDVKDTFPTDFDDPSFSTLHCLDGPALANCGFDGAGATLEFIYGTLKPRGTGFGDGTLLDFDQNLFASRAQGLDDVGYLYVPADCEAGVTCRLHVFLHALNQSNFTRGDLLFPKHSGHVRWAETNRMIVLFPQTYPHDGNNRGAWDTSGVYDAQFNQKGGTQIEAIMAMVARITSGYRPSQAIEYRHAGFGHYFVTAEQDEIDKLDAGASAGWARTGEQFAVQALGASGTVNVCRFFGRFGVKSSHFYALEGVECDKAKLNPDWEFEGLRFAVYPADAAGTCATDMQPLFRLYNAGYGGAPNHRYTTSTVTRGQMLATGWVPEGAGDGVVACVTP